MPDHIARVRAWGFHYADTAIRVAAPLNAGEASARIEYMRARLVHCLIVSVEERCTNEPPELGEAFAEIASAAFDERIAQFYWALSGGGQA